MSQGPRDPFAVPQQAGEIDPQDGGRTAQRPDGGEPVPLPASQVDGGRDPEVPPAPQADGDWHRLHPVTPVVRSWKILAVLIVLYGQQRGGDLLEVRGADDDLPIAFEVALSLGVLLLGGLAAALWSLLSWRMTRYRVGAEAVHLNSGVLFRQQRQARLDRLQAVDVVQPLLARLLGLCELKLEVAGGSGSDVRLAYLPEAQAHQLRNTLLARAAGLTVADGEDAPEAPEREVVAIGVDRLLASLLRTGTTVAIVVAAFALAGVVAVTREAEVLVGFGPAALGLVVAHWTRFTGEFGFRVAVSPDGLRLRHGLLESRAQTVPPGRVQAVRLIQPLLWRGRDWWRVEMNVAGYGGPTAQESVLLPVGTRDEAVGVLALVLPDLGVDDPRSVVDEGLTGTAGHGGEDGWTASPRRARWLDPVGWSRNGHRVTRRALLLRRGRLERLLDVVPHERTQSLGLRQGPLQRRLGLGSVHAHSTSGPVSPQVQHLDVHAAAALLHEQAGRARVARASARPERWMEPEQPRPAATPDRSG